jgi:hypothetical protein
MVVFVRIRVAHEVRAVARRRRSAREPRDRQVERTPEEMDRARLADEACPPLGEDRRDARKDLPAAVRRRRIVGVMDGVVLETNRIGNLDRHRPDAHAKAHALQQTHHLAIEIRYGLAGQRVGLRAPVGYLHAKLMHDEVELDCERSPAVREQISRQPARRHLEGATP